MSAVAEPRAASRQRWTVWLRQSRIERLVLATIYTVFFSVLSVRKHEVLQSTALDLALFDNILWNTAHGHLFESWIPPFAMGNYLSDHLSPILLVFALPYVLYHDPRILLVLQSVVLGAGALPVGNLAERRLGSRLAGVLFATCYLAYPFVGFLNLWDFHQECVLVTALLWAFDLSDRRRTVATVLSLAAAISTKEEAALAVAAFGIYLAVRYRQTILGLGIATFAVAYFTVAIELIIPSFRQGLAFVYSGRYAHLGTTPLEVAFTLATSPQRLIGASADSEQVLYLRHLFAPLPAALLGPLPLLTSLPILVGNLASNLPSQYDITYHYSAGVAPGIVVASIEGSRVLARLIAAVTRRLWPARKSLPLASVAVATLSLVTCLCANASLNAIRYGLDRQWFRANPKMEALERIAPAVPEDASLAASWMIAAHFSGRRVLTPFPLVPVRTEYALVDLSETYTYTYPNDVQTALRQMQTDGYVEVARSDPFVLLRRLWDGDPPELPPAATVRSVDQRYGDVLTLADFGYAPATEAGDRRWIVRLRWRTEAPTAERYGVRLRLVTRRGESISDWWNGLSPRVTPWTPRLNGLVSDRYYLDLPDDVAGLVAVHLMVEPYVWPQMVFLSPAREADLPAIRVETASPFDDDPGVSLGARFGELAILERTAIASRVVRAGESIAGALRWRALVPTDVEYTVSVQLVGDSGLVAQDDARPNRGFAPTTSWQPDDLVDHRFRLTVPKETPPGRYRLLAILYDPASGARVPVGSETYAEIGTVEVK